jgi:leucyl/phenylalanyl-tRNA--protein transferase
MRAVGRSERLSPKLLIRAYTIGIFPMARTRSDRLIHWVAPTKRGILPLDAVHVPRRLRRTVRSERFTVRCDADFAAVIAACAASAPDRRETWINAEIERVYGDLHRMGFAHSVETWREGRLVGGLYGVALGGAFFGESMFSLERDASKVALVHLVARLVAGGFALLDIQFLTEHLQRFGAIEIAADLYQMRLAEALRRPARFYGGLPPDVEGAALAALLTQSTTQTS